MSGKASKFGFLRPSRPEGEPAVLEATVESPPLPSPEEPASSPPLAVVAAEPEAPRAKTKTRVATPEPVRRVGRPTGKRSDGEHVQVTAYIRKETHRLTKMALLQEQKDRDFSELVEELLTKWLKSRT